MATDTDSMYDNMTRLRMKMVQQKLANERDRLQRPESQASENGDEDQLKLRTAMLKRQELIDRIREEQLNEERPRTHTPRKRQSVSSVSRRSLPDINNKNKHFDYHGNNKPDMAQVKHVIEHQFRPAPQQGYAQFPALQAAIPQPLTVLSQPVTPAELVPFQALQPAYSWPALALKDNTPKKDTMFNKSDFMDMMMLQNAQMHHMVMQQIMLQQLPGGSARPCTIPYAEPAAPVALVRPAPSIYHHHISQPTYSMPPLDYRGGGGNGHMYGRNYNNNIFDDGSNYYRYH